jgi:hypothetical protein
MIQAGASDTAAEVHLTDTTLECAPILRLLFDLFCNKPFAAFDEIPTVTMLSLIRLAQKYDCAGALRVIQLLVTQPNTVTTNAFNRFYYACALDDVETAHRFLPLAAAMTWPDTQNHACSVLECKGPGSRLDVTRMSTFWIDQLPRNYFLALLRATSLRIGAYKKWITVADEFRDQVKMLQHTRESDMFEQS